jgi:hypothetical protein
MPTPGDLTMRCPYCSAYPAPFHGVQSFSTVGKDSQKRVWYPAWCPACGSAVIMELNASDGNTLLEGRMYPESVGEWRVDHLPEEVAAEWEEAISVFQVGAHASAVVAAGRSLEAAAEVLEMPEGTLDQRIQAMREFGLITDQFKEAMDYARVIRNVGAHSGRKVSPETAEGTMRFTQQALRLLFEVPGELARLTGHPPEAEEHEPAEEAQT